MQKHHLLHVLFLSGLLTACGGSGSDSEPPSLPDFDNDGIADNVDTDDDNDGIADTSDAFPFDASEWLDTDLDGVGDNADEDDDNDGTPDIDDAFPLDSTEQTDTDADGIGNNADEDDDNDGTPDIDDAFPLDPTEQIDTDGDGIGNNADEDDDNDGVPDSEDAFPLDPNESADADGDGIGDNADFYPNDVVCHVELDGNGEQCYLTYFKENKLNIQTYTFDGTITFFDSAEKQIIQLNSETLSFNAPITIDVADDLSSLAYSSSDQMFYAGSLQGVVYAIDSTGAGVILYESDFAVRKVSLFGEFVAFIDDGYDLTTVDKNGSFNSRHSGYSTTLETEWDSATQSAFIYEVDKDKNPFLARVSIIQQNGIVDYIVSRFVDAERTTNRSLILSKDESESVIYAGKVFSQSELDELADESISPVFNDWLDGVGLITLDYAASDTSLTWYSEDFDVYANTVLRGRALGLALTESRAIVITERLSQFQISTFEFSDDVDGDQVSNEVDAFPNDIAASVDSDGDGYPDMWNDGKSDGDSTTGLSLDAFPSQYDCFLETHANAQGTCDHSATIPNSTPTSVMTGPQDTAFIYMAEQGRIYVYDGANDEFSASLDFADHQRGLGLEQAPQQIIYNASHERFYFHYSDDMLFARDYSDGVLSEAAEVSTFEEETINNLVNVGDYILVRMLGYRGVRYLFDSNGVQTDTDSTNYFSRAALYDENRQRIYHFRDGISPNDLMYTEIDVSSGSFGASVDSPYHGDYAFYGSINLVNNEQDIVIGSGDIFDAEDLTWKGSYGPLEAIAGLANDEVVVFTDNGDATRLTRKDSTNRTLETRVLASSHVDVVKTENATLLVYSTDDALVVEPYVANNDSDEDGVTNLDDAFPLDPAASLDSDNDGYPDEWNAGFTESDSTTGLSLDAFPNDSACWLSSHADADGFCDYSATMPTFTPDETFVDSNGIVHLVSFENASVYRWSPESSSFINPIKIGRNDGFVQSTPVLAAISNSHGRLYFGYESGQITFIDLDDVSSEQAFYRLPQRVGGLHAVGDFVLAQDASGSWETHYIIDENGVLTDSEDWNRFSSHYAWNDVKQRVYFFRDTTSPNDIHFETVDQTSGQITESGESPYHGEYQIQGPIVISALGEQVILGSGDIYDADDLTWLGNIGQFSQAIAYTNGEIGVLRSQGDGYIYARLDESGRVLEEYTVSASFAVLASNGTDSTLVTLDDSGEYSIVPVVANNDTDGDGVSNIEDAFPLDPAASVDSDGDGYPDYWNMTKTTLLQGCCQMHSLPILRAGTLTMLTRRAPVITLPQCQVLHLRIWLWMSQVLFI